MSRPVIGICAALERARWSVWDLESVLVPHNYVEAVQRAGAMGLLVPPDPALVDDPGEVLDGLDGLMLAGGADIDPSIYGAQREAQTVHTVPRRDAVEVALAREALARDVPLLGICRGMQLLNVACGGTLHQHVPDRFGHHEHLRVRGSFDGADHDVWLAAGSLAARVAGTRRHATKSHHHQGIDRVGEGLVVSGRAADDLPEALEEPTRRFALGVQWHPEADPASPVIGGLVEAARAPAPAG